MTRKELIKQLKKSKTCDQIKKPNIFHIYEKAGLCELLSAEILQANELTAA